MTKAQQLEGITTPRPEWDTEDDTDTILTEDEMSVNTINKNKAKLFSHILNPKNKVKSRDSSKKTSRQGKLEETEGITTSDVREAIGKTEEKITPKTNRDMISTVKETRNDGSSPKRRKVSRQQAQPDKTISPNDRTGVTSSNRRGGRKQPQSAEFVATTDEEEENEDGDEEEVEDRIPVLPKEIHTKENIKPPAHGEIQNEMLHKRKTIRYTGKSNKEMPHKQKSYSLPINKRQAISKENTLEEESADDAPDLVTVNMDDIPDLLYTTNSSNKGSKSRQEGSKQEGRQVFFARKSEPNKGSKASQNSNRQRSTGTLKDVVSSKNGEDGEESLRSRSIKTGPPSAADDSLIRGSKDTKRNKNNKSRDIPPSAISTCPICDKTFKIKTNLQLHLEKV